MTWLLDLALGFLPDFWPWLLGAIGGVVLFLTGRSSGKAKAKQKQAEVALDKTVKGQEAARKGRAEASEQLANGKSPEEVRRQNDGKW
jgi:hypothetical protein